MPSRFQPTIGWFAVFKQTAIAIYTDDYLGWSAQLAYSFFLSLFPALLFLVALASYFPLTNELNQIIDALSRFAPADVLQIVSSQLEQISNSKDSGLLTVGIIGTLLSASSGMSALIDTLNLAYRVKETRSWLRTKLRAIALTIVLSIFLLVSFVLVLAGYGFANRLAEYVRLSAVFTAVWAVVYWPLIFALVVMAIAIVYHYAPNVEQDWVWIAPGAIVAALLWVGVSFGFRWYVVNLGHYQKTYGTIGGVIIALIWFYVSGLSILIGAQLNAVIEHASPTGKNVGEHYPGQHAQQGDSPTDSTDERRRTGASSSKAN
jgi:membrane protein